MERSRTSRHGLLRVLPAEAETAHGSALLAGFRLRRSLRQIACNHGIGIEPASVIVSAASNTQLGPSQFDEDKNDFHNERNTRKQTDNREAQQSGAETVVLRPAESRWY